VETFTTVAALRHFLRQEGGDAGVGFVPTMGALHEGHRALVRAARRESRLVVASVFVNPLQFGPGEDFERYPRDLPRDAALLAEEGVDALFAPGVAELVPESQETYVDVPSMSQELEGRVRPGHFRGVATIVTKLFHIVAPERAYFGQKDWQQAMLVHRLVRDLAFPITLRVMPTVRADDGLAESSRNAYLDAASRQRATILYRSLVAGERVLARGVRRRAEVEAVMAATLAEEPTFTADYAVVRSAYGLKAEEQVTGDVALLVAGRLAGTHLIDNFVLRVEPDGVRPARDAGGWTFTV
jgi:pantoate--beta-alanine ligase